VRLTQGSVGPRSIESCGDSFPAGDSNYQK
jgi:hypothetical protein